MPLRPLGFALLHVRDRVLAVIGRGHAGPALDLGVLARLVDRVDVARSVGGRSVMVPSVSVDAKSATISPLVRALFWISAALLVWTQALYAPALAAAAPR